jgi:Family of unknown function (DUF5302)
MADNQEPATTDPDDPKEKFRQALERKNQGATDGVGGGKLGESPHGKADTHAHGGKRQFRRKAGG